MRRTSLAAVLLLLASLPLMAQEEKPSEQGDVPDPWNPPKVKQQEPAPASTQGTPKAPEPVGAYPVAELRRPLSLPAMTLEPHLALVVDFYTPDRVDNFVTLRAGASMGIIEYLEAGLDFLMALAPEVEAGMDLYGQYEIPRMLDGQLLLAGRLRMMIPFSDGFSPFFGFTKFNILFEGPVKYRLGDSFGLIGCAGLGTAIGRGNAGNAFLLHLAAGALFQPIEPLALSVKMDDYNFLADASQSVLSLVMEAQYTLFSDLDVSISFGFMDLTEGADWLQLLLSAAYRIDL